MATPDLLRSRVAGLTALASRDLTILWRKVSDAAQAGVLLNDVLPSLIQTYGEAAAVVAAEWYDDARDKAGVSGRFGGIPAPVRNPGTPGLVAWAGAQATDLDTMLPLIIGGVQKRIANASRDTVIGSSLADPRAGGWQRAGNGDCRWCDMLIGRGAVYSEATADFAAHDNCLCTAAPAFNGKPVPVRPYTVSPRRTIDPETGKPIIDADFLRAKKWIAEHL